MQGFQRRLNSDSRATYVTWFMQSRGIALHYFPIVPDYAASHGCMRIEFGACAPTDPRQLTGRPDPSRCKWSLEKAAEAVDLKNSEFESALLTLSEHVRKFRDLTVLFFNPKGHI